MDLLGGNKHPRTHQVQHIVDVTALAHRHSHKQVIGQDSQNGAKQNAPHRLVYGDFLDVLIRMPERNWQPKGIGIGYPEKNPDAASGLQSQPEGRVGDSQVAVFPVILIAGLALIHQLPVAHQEKLHAVYQRQCQLQYPVGLSAQGIGVQVKAGPVGRFGIAEIEDAGVMPGKGAGVQRLQLCNSEGLVRVLQVPQATAQIPDAAGVPVEQDRTVAAGVLGHGRHRQNKRRQNQE